MAEGAAEATSEQCRQLGLQTWVAWPGRAGVRVLAPPTERPAPSALPRAEPAPTALTQQREGGSFVPPRTPFLSATIERVSFFRRSGCENQVRPARLRGCSVTPELTRGPRKLAFPHEAAWAP